MTNAIELYRDAGHKAAIAGNQQDWKRTTFEHNHMLAMLALEKVIDRHRARKAYEDAYRAARKI